MIGPSARQARRIVGISVLALAALLWPAPGCSTPLLSPEDPRSQYDRYDAVRGQYASQYTEDEFGRRRPNLRARLSPKD